MKIIDTQHASAQNNAPNQLQQTQQRATQHITKRSNTIQQSKKLLQHRTHTNKHNNTNATTSTT